MQRLCELKSIAFIIMAHPTDCCASSTKAAQQQQQQCQQQQAMFMFKQPYVACFTDGTSHHRLAGQKTNL
jgi:hypothetical protein